jgi:magnesium chelatase subunit I
VEVRPDSAGRAHLRQAADPQLTAHYPFTALVEQERLKTALLLNAVNPAVGGVLVVGPSGTGKSTAVRGLAALLPEIEVVADCPFSCSPAEPCERCAARRAAGEDLPVVARRVRIVTLPLNATEDRVAGSVDIARVNRGILYVDEVNLLDDHLCDVLLDAAAMGVNVVEREGVSMSHPARFLLVGTMNPEEGELRPQIADRIGLHVEVQAIADTGVRAEVLRRREAYLADPEAFAAAWHEEEAALADRLRAAALSLPAVQVPARLYEAIARLVVESGVVSHRADVTILECAKGLAALAGRDEVDREDVFAAAQLALGHRIEQDPFGPGSGIDERLLRRTLDDVLEVGEAPKKVESPARPG